MARKSEKDALARMLDKAWLKAYDLTKSQGGGDWMQVLSSIERAISDTAASR